MKFFQDILSKWGLGKVLTVAGITIASIVFFILFVWLASPEMKMLFNQLDPSDSSRIVDKLKKMGISFEVKEDKIFVPETVFASVRMELAHEGLPNGGAIGYELFDKNDMFGATSSLMDVNRLRALEGELAKSIRTIQGIAHARVHLVLPKRELFSQKEAQSSASVMIKMKGPTKLSSMQVQAIQYLIASSVPGLTTDHVSIVDDRGNLLARGQDSTGASAAEGLSLQHEMKSTYEFKLAKTIESLLERTLGPGKMRAEVSVEMDFDKVTSTTVDFNPDGQVAKTTSSSEEGDKAQETHAQDSVSIQNALPEGGAQPAQTNPNQQNQSSKSEENTTYEISNTTKTYVREIGTIKRLSVAVLIDGTYENSVYTPRSKEEIEQITILVKSAIGYKQARGDTINVVNMRFAETAKTYIPQGIGESLSWIPRILGTKLIEISIIIIFGLLTIFWVLRPLMLRILQKTEEKERREALLKASRPDQYGDDAEMVPYKGEETIDKDVNPFNLRFPELSTRRVSEIIRKHPEETINVLRGWMYTERK